MSRTDEQRRTPGPVQTAVRSGTPLTLTLLLWAMLPAAGGAQSTSGAPPPDLEALPRPTVTIGRVSGIEIDGRLDEPAWASVVPITAFRQAQPFDGEPASEETAVYLGYDEGALYVAAEMHDSDPQGLITKSLERDAPGILFEEMDALGIGLDTFLDRRNSFVFFVNPEGGLKDGQTFDNGRSRDYGWNGVVDVRTTVHDQGWTVEMRIPWRTLRFDPGLADQRWGLNLMRRIRRKNEVSYWAPLDRRNRIFLVSLAGTMEGLGTLPAGRNLTVKPFALATRASGTAIATDLRGNEADAGIDLKYGITPNLTLDLTYRTDFSQVEADQEQVNLTRFPLFFPEQREFFLENSGTFTFGDVNHGPGSPRSGTSLRDFTLFHSREIGLKSGTPVPLLGGARLSGRVGPLEVGLLNMQSEEFAEDPAENFSVVRLRKSVLGDSDVGVMFTNRQATGVEGGAYNRTVGFDTNLRLAGHLYVNAYGASSSDGEPGDGEAARLAVGWRDAFWDLSSAVRRIGADFDPGIGFVRRTGIREGYATVGVHPRVGRSFLQEINPYVEGTYITDLDGRLETREVGGAVAFSFADRSSINVSYTNRFERLSAPFRVSGTEIPMGDYSFNEGSARYSSSQGRSFSGSVNVSGGGYFGGTRFSVGGSGRWQPSAGFTAELEASRNDLSVQGQDFTVNLYSARLKYAVSTTLNFGAFVQYNGDTGETITNLRANLIHAPLSDLFLLYTERRERDGGGVLERFVTLKVTRLLVF
ncbi:MAG: DUF5916 domain-containing protein [Gemmatimonadota bacterium]